MDIGVVFIWGLLQIILLGTFLYKFFDAHVHSLLLSINVGVELSGNCLAIGLALSKFSAETTVLGTMARSFLAL